MVTHYRSSISSSCVLGSLGFLMLYFSFFSYFCTALLGVGFRVTTVNSVSRTLRSEAQGVAGTFTTCTHKVAPQGLSEHEAKNIYKVAPQGFTVHEAKNEVAPLGFLLGPMPKIRWSRWIEPCTKQNKKRLWYDAKPGTKPNNKVVPQDRTMHEAKQKKVMTRGQTWHEANKREIPKIYPRSDTKTYSCSLEIIKIRYLFSRWRNKFRTIDSDHMILQTDKIFFTKKLCTLDRGMIKNKKFCYFDHACTIVLSASL